jgi:hypothetical protein
MNALLSNTPPPIPPVKKKKKKRKGKKGKKDCCRPVDKPKKNSLWCIELEREYQQSNERCGPRGFVSGQARLVEWGAQ